MDIEKQKGTTKMNARTLKLWKLKLTTRLEECWRTRKLNSTVIQFIILPCILLSFAVLMFIWRIASIDPSSCEAPVHKTSEHSFTIVLNTYKRPERLVKSIKHYSQCSNIDAIRIVWSEKTEPPEALKQQSHIPVIFDVHEHNSINNRFRPLKDVRTEGVFNVDDDILVDCNSLQFAFETWRLAPDTLVGFNARIHSKGNEDGKCGYGYKQWWHVWWGGRYSIVLTKAAFCHHKYFEMYTEYMPKQIWNHVHQGRNCEDIAMQFLISNSTALPPIWVQGSYSDSGVIDFKGGVSTGKNHYKARSACLTKFAEAFGRMPLVITSISVSPFSTWSPLKTPPAIWEWLHPI